MLRLLIICIFAFPLLAAESSLVCATALSNLSKEVNERLSVRGVTDSQPIEKSMLMTTSLKSSDVKSKEFLEKQANEVADFLANIYVAAKGNEINLPFREIRIAEPKSWMQSRMHIEGDTLVIHPPVTSSQLSADFKAGKHLEKGPFWNPNPVRKNWKFLNPVGEFRTQLRQNLELARSKLQKSLASIEGNPNLSDVLQLVDAKRLDPVHLKKLEEMSSGKLQELIALWKNESEKQSHLEALEKAVGASIKNKSWVRVGGKHELSPDIKSFQFGLVSVGNYHNIEVNLSDSADYSRYLATESPERPKVNSVSIGLIASVYTVDRVQVNLDGALTQALETLLLDKALSKVK